MDITSEYKINQKVEMVCLLLGKVTDISVVGGGGWVGGVAVLVVNRAVEYVTN